MSCDEHREHVAVSVHREHRINLGRAAGICSPCDTSDKYKDNLPTACQRSCIGGRDKRGKKLVMSSLSISCTLLTDSQLSVTLRISFLTLQRRNWGIDRLKLISITNSRMWIPLRLFGGGLPLYCQGHSPLVCDRIVKARHSILLLY